MACFNDQVLTNLAKGIVLFRGKFSEMMIELMNLFFKLTSIRHFMKLRILYNEVNF